VKFYIFFILNIELFFGGVTFTPRQAHAIITSGSEPYCSTTFGPSRYCADGDAESYLAFKLNSFAGDRSKSMTGSYSYNLSLTTVTSKDPVSFLMGGQIGYSNTNVYINDGSPAAARYISLDIPLGVSIKFFRYHTIRPVLDIYGLVGFKSLDMGSPPSGVDNKTLSLSYGYGGSFGLEFSFTNYTGFRATIDYEDNKAMNLANQDAFNLSALCFKVGFVFAEFDDL
jgi:hypothetical protein